MLYISNYGSGSGSGTVTSVSIVTANGVSGSVATATTTPAITLTLGAITPTSVNGVRVTTGLNGDNSNVAIGLSGLGGTTSGVSNTVVGSIAGGSITSGGGNTALGYGALFTASTTSTNTAIGVNSLYSTTGSSNVGIGYFSGKYETGSNAFYVDNQDRTNTAGDKASALLYGTFNATPSSQTLKTNSAFEATYGMNIPTGQTYKINGVPLSGTGTVTSVTSANADISVATTTTTPVLTLNSATTATASTIVKRDASANIYVNNSFTNSTSTVSAAGTTVLTIASSRVQRLTGTSNQTFQLPNATTLPTSSIFEFDNNSSGTLTITNAGAATLYTMPAGVDIIAKCTDNSTSNGVWDFHALAPSIVTWSSGASGLVMNTALTTTPSILSGISSSTAPSFIPQRGASTTGFGGDGTNLYATIGGTAIVTIATASVTVPAINKVTITAPATSATLTIANGKTLTVSNTLTFTGTDGSTLNIGTGGTLGTAAYTASTAYEVPLTFSTGLTRTTNTITVNTSQNISTLSNLTSNGLVTTSGGTGALSVTVPGTGVLTALAVNVGSAGAFVTFNGALGTPTSGTVTNLTGTASININGTVGATTPTTGSFTTVTTSGNIELGNASDTTVSRLAAAEIAVEGVRIKTTTPKVLSAASYTTDTGASLNMDNLDMFIVTAQAGALLFNAPGGTLVQGRTLVIRIKDNGTARALTWNAIFRAMGTALPSTTVLSKTLYLGFFYNSTDTKWDLVASAQEA